MVLEATIIVIDNSESSRNGDYVSTRYEAQADTAKLIYHAKTGANPESSVGMMSMGGTSPEVLTTLTTDFGKILDGLHRTKIKGVSHFTAAINIAALALKHRQNKNSRQRIIIFSCSPIEDDEKAMVRSARRMKKYSVSVDIIAFGELDDGTLKKLRAFHDNVKSGDDSHLEIVPPGPNLLSDVIVTGPILAGEGGSGGAGATGDTGDIGASQFEFGVNPEVDPDLAMALRMSYEEEKARQERERKVKEEEEEANKEKLEGIPEDDEKQPLLDGGEPSGSGSGSKDRKDKDDEDKMDTA